MLTGYFSKLTQLDHVELAVGLLVQWCLVYSIILEKKINAPDQEMNLKGELLRKGPLQGFSLPCPQTTSNWFYALGPWTPHLLRP